MRPVLPLLLVALLVGPAVATTLPPCGATSECGGAPAVETCGNCADDDGDGLVDWADDDCCASDHTLALEHLAIRGTTVRLVVRHSLSAGPDDTTLQLADDRGVHTCATLGAGSWRGTQRFDEGRRRQAGGFRRARLDGDSFAATARGSQLAALAPGGLHVTLRIGSSCARVSTSLRPRRRLLVAP